LSEKSLLTGIRCTDEDWVAVLHALEEGKSPAVEEMIISTAPLSQAIDGAFLEFINNTQAQIKILVQPDA
jgi:hypothetical protein